MQKRIQTSICAENTDKCVSCGMSISQLHSELDATLPASQSLMESQIMQTLGHCDEKLDSALIFLVKKCCKCLYQKKYVHCIETAEHLLDFSWEKLNSFHWKDVPLVWQKIYSISCVFKACAMSYNTDSYSDFKAICYTADMGLLMGANVLDGVLHKIIDIFRPLPVQNTIALKKSSPNLPTIVNPIEKLSMPPIEIFQRHYMNALKPAILDYCMEHWPARSLWSFDYLNKIAGHRLVPVEVGSRYTDTSWGQRLMLISEFIDNFILNEDQKSKAYLAQHQLFKQIPQLKNDIDIPDYCCISNEENFDPETDTDINAWFGPSGTVSPCHHDPKHNLLAQVVGRKYVRLYPPSCSSALYPMDGMMSNTSQVDVENADSGKFKEFPLMDEKHRLDCILKPGQMLYIPPKWWHYIRSLDESFSVSFWWN